MGDRIAEFHFAALRHILQQNGGKSFGAGADFKYRVAIGFLRALVVELAVAADLAAFGGSDTNDDADTFFVLPPLR